MDASFGKILGFDYGVFKQWIFVIVLIGRDADCPLDP